MSEGKRELEAGDRGKKKRQESTIYSTVRMSYSKYFLYSVCTRVSIARVSMSNIFK